MSFMSIVFIRIYLNKYCINIYGSEVYICFNVFNRRYLFYLYNGHIVFCIFSVKTNQHLYMKDVSLYII